MKPVYRGVAVAVLQCLIVLSLAGKSAIDRDRLPRAWARALPVDPNLPIRGRYVSLRLEVERVDGEIPPPGSAGPNRWPQTAAGPVQLSAQDGMLVATPSAGSETLLSGAGNRWSLWEPVAFFIPEHVPDPSRRAAGEQLWVEVSVPRKGPPRPLRLGVKKDGVLTPLDL
jgi:hypothetical protein